MTVAIWPEFKSLIPPLDSDERAQLEANLAADGCRDPLVVWRRAGEPLECAVLLDGHNRYEICTRLGIHYEIVEVQGVESVDDARLWIVRNQLGRRNITAFVRTELVLIAKPIIEAKAKANQQGGQGGILLRENSHEATRTDETLADMAGVSSNTIRKVERIQQEAPPELIEAVRRNDVSIHLASQVVDLPDEERTQAIEDALSDLAHAPQVLREAVRTYRAIGSGENEWYTPAEYAEMARSVMGSIDLDPASCDEANDVIKADAYYTKDDDGLSKEWRGNVWCNPPYSRDLMPAFVEKLKDSYASGHVRQAILVSHNNTDTAWFHSLASVASAICFPKKRIKFYRGDDIAAPTNGQAFFYLGAQTEAFKDAFCGVGFVVAPI
jgi:hypothetical protein